MNLVILSGRIVRDPDIRYSQSADNMAIARFTLAVDRSHKKSKDEQANFINCTCFGKTAEIVEKYCRKGTKLIVSGEWITGHYTDKAGNKVYTNDCNVAKLEFAESRMQNDEHPQPMTSNGDGFMNIPDNIGDELPFN